MSDIEKFDPKKLAESICWTVEPSELHRDLMSVCGLNFADGNDSSSRKQMFASHIGQALQVSGACPRRIQTGMEREYGKYTLSIKMPADGEIKKVIDRYQRGIGIDSIPYNPQTLVIYEDAATKQIGMIDLRDYCSFHQYFGFKYKSQSALNQLHVGAHIKKGTILKDSPAVGEDGSYSFGVECNMALMSIPGTSEDGIIICRDVLPKFKFKTYEHRVVEWGNRRFPLNIYGDETNYKAFPEIGEYIKDTDDGRGLLMAFRTYDKDMAVVEQSVIDTMEVDYTYDKLVYADPGGRIVDIRVHHDNQINPSPTPVGMDTQVLKYDRARRKFYQDIFNEYQRLARDAGPNLTLTPEFHQLVVDAIAVIGDNDGQRVFKLYRQAPLDDFRVEFVIEYEIEPTIGFKLTDCHGGKGVICQIWEPWQMPVDADGNRADIIMDPYSRISRMNLGGLYEQYFNAASRDVVKRIHKFVGAEPVDPRLYENHLQNIDQGMVNHAWEYLLGYYAIVSPRMHRWFTEGEYKNSRHSHLAEVLKRGIYLYYPPDNEIECSEAVKLIEQFYPPTYGPVTYTGASGRTDTTKDPVRIASMYIMLLEKIGDDWTAVSSAKTQHFGVLAQVTNTDKHSTPSRNQAIRALGESEVRIYTSYVGTKVTADIMDRSNNPITHEHILFNILDAAKPTDIPSVVDRKKIPLGGARPLKLVKHIAQCAGWRFVYKPYDDKAPKGTQEW